jgi:iron complex transport system substrate-binding protein
MERLDLLDVDALACSSCNPDPRRTPMRPATRLLAALSAGVIVMAAACGGDDDDAAPSTDSPTAAPAADATPATESPATEQAGAFPVTVEHAFGSTEVTAEPERIVTVGLTEQDGVLALGMAPVGVTEWYGDQPFATWPWAQDELGDAEPEVLSQTDGFQYERIAALEPDLILGLNAGIDEESYARLSEIAPTIAHAAGAEAYFSPWREQTRMIGQALGKEADAEALIADVDAEFEAAAAEHPEFDGINVIFLQNAFYDGQAIAYQEGLSTDFLTDLGFVIPDDLDPFVGSAEGSQAFIPLEQLTVLDAADVLLWATESPDDRVALEQEPLYTNLEEVQAGHQVFTDGLSAGAIYFTSPLSLPFALEALVPAFASTLAGVGPADAFGIPLLES